MLGQQILVNTRFVVEAFEVGGRDQLDEVFIAFLVLAKEDEMIVAVVGLAPLPSVGLRDVDFTSDDGIDALLMSPRTSRSREHPREPTIGRILLAGAHCSRYVSTPLQAEQ